MHKEGIKQERDKNLKQYFPSQTAVTSSPNLVTFENILSTETDIKRCHRQLNENCFLRIVYYEWYSLAENYSILQLLRNWQTNFKSFPGNKSFQAYSIPLILILEAGHSLICFLIGQRKTIASVYHLFHALEIINSFYFNLI